MGDLEQQLAGVLTDAAEGAPGATGLADAARRRHRVRRQRRLALGGAVAALVIGVGTLVLQPGDDGANVVKDPTDGSPAGWQTIRSGDALASIPPDWVAYDCPSGEPDLKPIYGPPTGDSCADGVGAVFLPSARDLGAGPGVLEGTDGGVLGNVGVGTGSLRVFHPDEALVRQILSTARGEGQPVIDGSRWVSFERDGMSYEVPAWWGLGEDGDHDRYSVCLYPADSDKESTSKFGEPYASAASPRPQGLVFVEAPTQAVAELVLATVRVSEGARPSETCSTEDFATGLLSSDSTPGAGTPVEGGETVTPGDDPTGNATTGDAPDEDFPALGEPGWETTLAEYDGIAAEIPTYWSRNFCNEAPQWTPYEDCTRPGEGLRLYGAGYPVDLGREPRELWRQDIEGRLFWTGYVVRGDVAVFVTHTDRRTVEVLLEQVH